MSKSKKELDCYTPINTADCDTCVHPLGLVSGVEIIVGHHSSDGGGTLATVTVMHGDLVSSKLIDRIIESFQKDSECLGTVYTYRVAYTCSEWNE